MTKNRNKAKFQSSGSQASAPAAKRRSRVNAKPSERGLGPTGGGWNIDQASAWSGIGSASLREMAKRRIETGDPSLFPCYLIGHRRILIPRQGFIDWFNGRKGSTAA